LMYANIRLIYERKENLSTKTQLADGTDAYLNLVLYDDGNFYLYTISKNITIY